jgi:hypothetical protein
MPRRLLVCDEHIFTSVVYFEIGGETQDYYAWQGGWIVENENGWEGLP